jgi:hypothetical protein
LSDTIVKSGLNLVHPDGLESVSLVGARMIYLLRVDLFEVTAPLRGRSATFCEPRGKHRNSTVR